LPARSKGTPATAIPPDRRGELRARVEKLIGEAGIVGAILDGDRVGAGEVDTADPGEPPFFAAADGFAQAGASGNRALRALVEELAGAAGARVLELHAGDGNFTRDLARVAKSVTAVEGDRRAVERLRRNAPAATALADSAERAARRLVDGKQRFDLVLIDPPRAGARELAPLLPRLAPRLVYVSCDPVTLGRDAAALAAAGLAPSRAVPLDLMPHTFHVETVCRFDATGAPPAAPAPRR
jgi:23S rRNA (uracil1939-C5)-methyltransferase